jgi:protein-S-isoprenylcysteine O-methyltransferase Ste14
VIVLSLDVLALRLCLFSGLALHKLVWEILKARNRPIQKSRVTRKTGFLKLIKLAKICALAFLLVQTLFLNFLPIMDNSALLRAAGVVIFTLGLAVAILGRVNLGKSWIDMEDYQNLPCHSLVTHGIHRFIRHPIYAGDFMLILGLELALNSWFVLAVLPLSLVIIKQSIVEEAFLVKVFPGYEAYRARTKKFIPFFY